MSDERNNGLFGGNEPIDLGSDTTFTDLPDFSSDDFDSIFGTAEKKDEVKTESASVKSETQEMYRKKFKGSYNKKWIGYVMVDELGNLIKPDYITESFPRLLKRHGMRRIRFHDLRHTSASLLLSRGVPLKDIQLWLGHSDFSTTANTYAHLDSSSKKASLEALVGVVHF